MLRSFGGLVVSSFRNVALKNAAVVQARQMSSKKAETDEEFDKRYEAYFNRTDIDGWEVRKAMNDLAGMDLVPEPSISIAALKACRRIGDVSLAIRWLEVIKEKSIANKDIYPYMLQELKPTLDELGVNTLEELGYDKPELALQNVYEIH